MYEAIAEEIGISSHELSRLLSKNGMLHLPESANGYQAKVHVPMPEHAGEHAKEWGIDPDNNKVWRYCVRKINIEDIGA